jgi:hypothetical protein
MEPRPLNGMWKALRAAGIAALFVLVLEVCARIDDAIAWDAPLLAPYSHDLLTVRDSLGVRNRAGYRYEKWSINSLGFRGREVASVPATGVERIVVLGASETFGLFEGEHGDYPAQLGARLDSLAPARFDVVNAARAGMMLRTMPAYYHRVIAPIRPSVVVIYPTPSFYLMEDAMDTPDATPRAGRGSVELSTMTGITTSRLVPKARQVVKSFIPVPIQEAMKRFKLARMRAAHPEGWVWDGVPADRMAAFEADLGRIVDEIRADGVEVVLLSHVNRVEKPRSEWTDDDHYRVLSEIMAERQQATEDAMVMVDSVAREATRRVASSRGVRYVELAGSVPPSAEYFADYSHFTDAGAARVAKVLADHLLGSTDTIARAP